MDRFARGKGRRKEMAKDQIMARSLTLTTPVDFKDSDKF